MDRGLLKEGAEKGLELFHSGGGDGVDSDYSCRKLRNVCKLAPSNKSSEAGIKFFDM
jgi:hypothetical protein